jgi:hypothetical protein
MIICVGKADCWKKRKEQNLNKQVATEYDMDIMYIISVAYFPYDKGKHLHMYTHTHSVGL